MPGLNGSGPLGSGPGTGRGRGVCHTGNTLCASGQGRWATVGYADRFRRGAFGGGFRRSRRGNVSLDMDESSNEILQLKAEAQALKEAIAGMEQKLGELEKGY